MEGDKGGGGRGGGERGKRKRRPSLLLEKLGNVGLAAAQTCAEGWFERGHWEGRLRALLWAAQAVGSHNEGTPLLP